jgi:hypothetical protein
MARRRSGLRHLYLAQMRHYNLAPTPLMLIINIIMSNWPRTLQWTS